MSGDGGTLESLHDVDQHLLDKLEGVGYSLYPILRQRQYQSF